MSEWRKLSKPETVEPVPLIFLCRWRYNAGQYCGVQIDRVERLCAKHKVEDRKRLAALRKDRIKSATMNGRPG